MIKPFLKICSKCKKPKRISDEFNKAKYGVRGDCKMCVSLKNRDLYNKNLKANRERSLKYYQDHCEERAQISKKVHRRHRESLNRNYILELFAIECHCKVSDVPEFLIHLKRQQLIFSRLLTILRKAISHGPN